MRLRASNLRRRQEAGAGLGRAWPPQAFFMTEAGRSSHIPTRSKIVGWLLRWYKKKYVCFKPECIKCYIFYISDF